MDEGVVAHAVDDVIHFEHRLGQFGLALDECFQCAAHHRTDGRTHARDINRQVGGGKFDHVHDAFGNVHGLIADTLEIGIDFGDG